MREVRLSISRLFIIGKLFGYTDKEIWHSTPKKLIALFTDYKEFHGYQQCKVTTDDIIP